MKKLFTLSLYLLMTIGAFAQVTNNQNVKTNILSGSFDIRKVSGTHNVNYHVKPEAKQVNILLHTAEPLALSISIADNEGNIKDSWTAEKDADRVEHSFNTSGYKKGNYNIYIYSEGKLVNTIPFLTTI